VPRLSQTRAYVALLLIAALWGTFPATSKLALEHIPPTLLTALRAVIASSFLVALLVRGGAEAVRPPSPEMIRAFFVLGVAGVVLSMHIAYWGIYTTTAANAAILQAASPIMIALGARLYLGERLRRIQQAGVALSMLGVLIVVTEGNLAELAPSEWRLGDFLTLLGLVAWTVYTVYGKRLIATVPPALATTGGYVCGTLVLVPLAIVSLPLMPQARLLSPVAWLVLVYHAVLGAIAHLWWYAAVERVGPSRAAVFLNLTPLVGMALAAVLLAEPIGRWQIYGVLLVLSGVALTTRMSRATRPGGKLGESVSGATRPGGELGGSPRPPQCP
jgi:drug/metabolite transporter (DMT)-like permease